MRGLSTNHTRSVRLKQFFYSLFVIANAAIGTGILAFPFAFKVSGYALAMALTGFGVMVNGYTLAVILKCARAMDATSYQQIVVRLFGARGERYMLLSIIVFCFFSNISYYIVIGSQLSASL